ncbi:hypothetical protein KR059_001601, partial [Drosophila kikkawai]
NSLYPIACLCLWHFGTVAPQISIQSRSSSSSRQTIDGQLKTVYDFTSQHDVNDISGKLVHTRKTDFKSDFTAP